MRYTNPTVPLLLFLFIVGLSIPHTAHGQALQTGTWTGEIIPPEGFVNAVTYDVIATNDSLAITLNVPNMGTIPFEDIALNADTLTFSWELGVALQCSLTLQDDGSFDGECGDAQGITGIVTMVPPKDEASN